MKDTTRFRNKFPVFIILLAIPAIILACNLPSSRSKVTALTEVVSANVDPSVGSGKFTLKVNYRVTATNDQFLPELIDCMYVAPDGATIIIGTISPEVGSKKGVIEQSGTLQIEATDLGNYSVTCRTISSSSEAQTSFTVEKILTATGQRVWDGLYIEEDPTVNMVSHCTSPVLVKLALRADGTAWMQTLGEGKYGAKCENYYRINDDTQNMEWTLVGLFDSQTETATFTTCNNTPGATGQVSFKEGVLTGNATCMASTDPQNANLKVTITIP